MAFNKLTTDLIDVYLGMISSDHHKQSDGYFQVALVYCGYDNKKPYSWEVIHEGYLHQGTDVAESYEKAEKKLQKMVCDFIADTIETYERCIAEPDEWDIMFPVDMQELIEKYNKMKVTVDA